MSKPGNINGRSREQRNWGLKADGNVGIHTHKLCQLMVVVVVTSRQQNHEGMVLPPNEHFVLVMSQLYDVSRYNGQLKLLFSIKIVSEKKKHT